MVASPAASGVRPRPESRLQSRSESHFCSLPQSRSKSLFFSLPQSRSDSPLGSASRRAGDYSFVVDPDLLVEIQVLSSPLLQEFDFFYDFLKSEQL